MAFTTVYLVSLLAVASADYIWLDQGEGGFNSFGLRMPQMPRMPQIRMPQMPFAPFPPTPPMFPNIYIPAPKIPSPDEIKNMKPGPNQNYNAIMVKSTSKITYDKDGNPVKTGGTSMLVNNNGDVKDFASGNNPPKLDDPIILPAMPVPPMMPHMPHIPIVPVVPVAQIDPEAMKNYKPGDNEHYVASSSQSFSSHSNVDGKETSSGGITKFSNVDGVVDEESIVYGDTPKN